MSIENRPYFNAAGFVVKLCNLIEENIRGEAEPHRRAIITQLLKVDSIFSSYAESIDMMVTSAYKLIEKESHVKSRNESQSNSQDVSV